MYSEVLTSVLMLCDWHFTHWAISLAEPQSLSPKVSWTNWRLEFRHVSKLQRLSLPFSLSRCGFQLLALWKIKECISEHACEEKDCQEQGPTQAFSAGQLIHHPVSGLSLSSFIMAQRETWASRHSTWTSAGWTCWKAWIDFTPWAHVRCLAFIICNCNSDQENKMAQMRHGLKGFVTWYLDTVTSHHGLHEHFMVCYPNIKATVAFFPVTCGLQIVGLISFPSSLTRFVI